MLLSRGFNQMLWDVAFFFAGMNALRRIPAARISFVRIASEIVQNGCETDVLAMSESK